jgi:hypothetical protein
MFWSKCYLKLTFLVGTNLAPKINQFKIVLLKWSHVNSTRNDYLSILTEKGGGTNCNNLDI